MPPWIGLACESVVSRVPVSLVLSFFFLWKWCARSSGRGRGCWFDLVEQTESLSLPTPQFPNSPPSSAPSSSSQNDHVTILNKEGAGGD